MHPQTLRAWLLWMCMAIAAVLLTAPAAHASGTVPLTQKRVWYWDDAPDSYLGDSLGALCNAVANDANASDAAYYASIHYTFVAQATTSSVSPGGTTGTCTRNWTINGSPGQANFNASSRVSSLQCGDHSTLSPSGNDCTCGSGYQPDTGGTLCVPPPSHCSTTLAKPLAGELTVPVSGKGVTPSKVCSDSCGYIPSGGGGAGFWAGKAGAWNFVADGSQWIGDGTDCTPAPVGTSGDPDKPAQPLPDPPPKGMCQGTQNGVTVTVPCDSTSNNGGPTSSGGAPTTGPSGPDSPASGATGTKSGTDCTGDTCTTTTTTTKNNGNGTDTTTTDTETTDKGTYCKDHPGDPNCTDQKPGWGGSCTAGFTCTGDAVQCAIAQETYRRNCENSTVPGGIQSTYDGLQGGGIAVSAGDTTVDLSNRLPAPDANVCALTDTTIAIAPGFTVALPLGTYLCSKLFAIKSVIVAFGSLLWVLIVMGRK